MKRLAILGLTALALVSGACGGGEKKLTAREEAIKECGTDDVTFVIGASHSGYNGKGPGWNSYRTGDGREVIINDFGDGNWGTMGSGKCE